MNISIKVKNKSFSKFKEIIKDMDLLIPYVKNLVSNGNAPLLYNLMKKISISEDILDDKSYNNFIELEKYFKKNVNGYKSILLEKSFSSIKKNVLLEVKNKNEIIKIKSEEKLKNKKLEIIRKNKINNKDTNDDKKKNKIFSKTDLKELRKERDAKIKYFKKYINGEIIFTDLLGKVSEIEIKEYLIKGCINNTLDEKQFSNYKRLTLMYTDINMGNLEEFNKSITKGNKNLNKSYNQGTYIVYNRNGK